MDWFEWEDWQAGMYQPAYTADQVALSMGLLGSPDVFLETAVEMVRAWPIAAVHNLRHMWTGRNAWIGQASCMYAHQAPSAATRSAWGQLPLPTQRAANHVAEQVRIRWEQRDVSETLFAV